MTPAARSVVEAVHAGATLTMHYRRDDSGETMPRFVLKPAGRGVYASTAQLAIATEHLRAASDSLFGELAPQTWTAGEPLPPIVDLPPFIQGSNVRDTAICGLTVRFAGKRKDRGEILHASSGSLLLMENDMPCGKREFVRRVDVSALVEGDWTLGIDELKGSKNDLYMPLVRAAREQIWGRK